MWRDVSARLFFPLTLRPLRDRPFTGKAVGYRLGSLAVTRLTDDAHIAERGCRAISRHDPEQLQIYVLRRGICTASQNERTSVLTSGDMSILDSSRPYAFEAQSSFELLILSIPRATLGREGQELSDLGASRISYSFLLHGALGGGGSKRMRTTRGAPSHVRHFRQRIETGRRDGMTESRSPSELIDERIEQLGDWRGELLARLRGLIKEAAPDVVEEWKWRGVPVWYHDGMLCTGETYKSAVKMTFAKGASLDDPSGLFNSSLEGNTRRAIDFHEGEEIDEEALKSLVRAAVAFNESKARR